MISLTVNGPYSQTIDSPQQINKLKCTLNNFFHDNCVDDIIYISKYPVKPDLSLGKYKFPLLNDIYFWVIPGKQLNQNLFIGFNKTIKIIICHETIELEFHVYLLLTLISMDNPPDQYTSIRVLLSHDKAYHQFKQLKQAFNK